ncbi:ubiquinone biosynthesis accessory factor UbiJ [Thaumasiovibrio subtropicus]|uniref:ubiquinone biosynthesis accessory factor UbiJ n=1 Tax=Thaumasiovibrio subtropicus TaxID=1891207 RepID=UPI000B35BA6E|nr:SCP2 sterol-binding domain-containing protein [Thaumasiovibrio subtropicus]
MESLPLHTPLKVLVSGAIEVALNKLLTEENRPQLKRMQGKVLQVTLKELSLTMTYVFSQQIDVLGEYEGEPDCHLLLNITALPQLQQQSQITRLIKDDKLDVEGDLDLAQQFSSLLKQLKPDWEEVLSTYTGDVVAHTLVSGSKRQAERLKAWLTVRERDIAEVVTEEWRLAPGPLEVAHFCDQVDDLRSAQAHLEARFEQLSDRLRGRR